MFDEGRVQHQDDAGPALVDRFRRRTTVLLPLDLLTTLLSVSHHGLAVEANPLMLWLLGRGLPDLVLAHLAVTVLAVSGFELVIRIVEGISSTTQTRVALGVEIWLGLLIVSGVLLVLNNLLTIV